MKTHADCCLRGRYWKANHTVMSYANSFSAGIFLASGLIHLLPEAIHGWPESHDETEEHSGHSHSVRMPFLLCAAGFFIAFFVEKIIFLTDEGHDACGDGHDHDHTGLIRQVAEGASIPPMAFLLTVVLSVHSLFGGMALGVSNFSTLSCTGTCACGSFLYFFSCQYIWKPWHM